MGKVERSLRNAMPVSAGQGQSTLTVRDGHVIKYSINSHLCNVNGACPCACDCVWNVRSWRRRVHIWVFMASVFVLQFLICVFFAELLIVFRTTSRPSFFFFSFSGLLIIIIGILTLVSRSLLSILWSLPGGVVGGSFPSFSKGRKCVCIVSFLFFSLVLKVCR